ncbi:hypothetical protein BO221_22775 [Archangium sp. Cb G35]|uniref:hypothetical protein n=1 Tax=Archangium sp. Cb G35 TaxID=1920190 RepID=UPI0009357259|nr:hypothetical protein [Archangium sp. Cb G35]OJT22590.1 hypothetical protein BO221_22775 [Archangium sp. Cb G35]
MLKAELHGKIADDSSNATERSEDVLTSNVFGTLSYLPPAAALLPWIARATPLATHARPLLPSDVQDAALVFWPKLAEREADLLLVLLLSGTVELVAIECKYHRGKSGRARNPGNELAADDLDEEPLIACGDQLADYLTALRAHNVRPRPYEPTKVRRVSLLYVTAHAAPPWGEFEESISQFKRPDEVRDAFYWLSWRDLFTCLPAAEAGGSVAARIVSDLRDLLDRKGLRPFAGFRDPAPPLTVPPAHAAFWRGSLGSIFFRHLSPPSSIPTHATWWTPA